MIDDLTIDLNMKLVISYEYMLAWYSKLWYDKRIYVALKGLRNCRNIMMDVNRKSS